MAYKILRKRHIAGIIFLMKSDAKIKLLNKLLATGSRCDDNDFANAAIGISKALENEDSTVSLDVFAKRILKLYDPNARVEVLEFGENGYSPLFAAPEINAAAKRLAGFDRAILVVSGLSEETGTSKGRASLKKKLELSRDIEFIEDSALKHMEESPKLEVLFI